MSYQQSFHFPISPCTVIDGPVRRWAPVILAYFMAWKSELLLPVLLLSGGRMTHATLLPGDLTM